MILGLGSDLVKIGRIEGVIAQFGERFLCRCFSPEERQWADRQPDATSCAAVYAKRWAAKEAVAKALGLGIAQGVYLRDIQVVRDAAGRPGIELSGGAKTRLDRITPPGKTARMHASLSDDAGFALAFVVIEGI